MEKNMEDDESHCKFVSSRGILKSCDFFSKTPHSSIRVLYGYDEGFENRIKDGDALYVCSSAIPDFCKMVHNIKTRFILVTGDCDECCWQDLFDSQKDFLLFMENSLLIHWFSQNCIFIDHPKLSPMPIGLDYHTMSEKNTDWGLRASPIEQEQELEMVIKNNAKPWNERLFQTCAYSNFHFSMETRFADDRQDAIDKIPPECIYYEPNLIKRVDTWKKQCDYVFVVSPFGNGLDCHRTWEALALGCIAIIKTSPFDVLFKDLPVWIVEDWSEINLMNMINVLTSFHGKTFRMEKLRLDYWMSEIRGKYQLV